MVAGAIRSLVNARDSCMKHCLYRFVCMALKQSYGRRIRDLELELYRWTTSEVWFDSGE